MLAEEPSEEEVSEDKDDICDNDDVVGKFVADRLVEFRDNRACGLENRMHRWQIDSKVESMESEARETELQFRELAKTAAQFEWIDRVAESQQEPLMHMTEIDEFYDFF